MPHLRSQLITSVNTESDLIEASDIANQKIWISVGKYFYAPLRGIEIFLGNISQGLGMISI
jgi:hypothetical protein